MNSATQRNYHRDITSFFSFISDGRNGETQKWIAYNEIKIKIQDPAIYDGFPQESANDLLDKLHDHTSKSIRNSKLTKHVDLCIVNYERSLFLGALKNGTDVELHDAYKGLMTSLNAGLNAELFTDKEIATFEIFERIKADAKEAFNSEMSSRKARQSRTNKMEAARSNVKQHAVIFAVLLVSLVALLINLVEV